MTCRDIHDLPRATRTYLIDNVFSLHHGFKVDIFSRFQRFSLSLLNSPLAPIRTLARILRSDVRSTFGQNLAKIGREAGIDPLATTKRDLISRLAKRAVVPDGGEIMIEVVRQLYSESRQGDLTQPEKEELKDHLDVAAVA